MKPILLSILLLPIFACRHQVVIETAPKSATITHKKEKLGQAPIEITYFWFPFRKFPLKAELNGYRTVNFDASKTISSRIILGDILHLRIQRLLGLKPRNTHTILLIREHGPAGTWTPEDAQL